MKRAISPSKDIDDFLSTFGECTVIPNNINRGIKSNFHFFQDFHRKNNPATTMAFFGKTYVLDKSENFEEYVKSLNLPSEKAESYLKKKESQKLDKSDDEYVLTHIYETGPVDIKFKSGVEFDEQIRPSLTAKSTFTLDGNKLIHVQKFPDGNIITYVREFSANQLVITITTNFWNGTCKKVYVAK